MNRTISLLLAAIVLFSASIPAAAQKFQPKNIVFKGDPEYSDEELLRAANLKKGSTLTAAEMSDHLKLLMDTGAFGTLTYLFDGVDLVFTMTPAPILYPIRLENLPLAPGKELDAKLHDRFPLYHGKVPSEGGLLESVRGALEESLAAQGVKATVAATPYSDLALKKVTAISFNITSPPVQIGEIHLDSGSAALDPKAQEILAKQSGSIYDSEGSPNQITTDLGNFYHDNGYLEADIHAAPQFPAIAATDAIRVPFALSVAPGTLYKLAPIQLAPGLIVTQADFDKQSRIHPGDIANSVVVRENWQFLARQYHNKGYLNAAVHPTPSFDHAQGTVTFSVNVEPGPAYTMGALKIENVSDDLRTRMLAAWKMQPGAVFNESAVLAFFAIGDAEPVLKRVFAAVNCKYVLTLNDDKHTADVLLRLEKKP